jgi:hypothetical protein
MPAAVSAALPTSFAPGRTPNGVSSMLGTADGSDRSARTG